MTTIPYSSSLISRFAIANLPRKPDGYYRSKLFISMSSSNPLISAANPLFSLLERLGLSSTLPPIETIRKNIEHELLAFQSHLTKKNYAEELAIIAHYLLCATVDELVGKNYMRLYKEPVEFVAFTPLGSENQGPQKLFFDIVNHLKEKTHQYLDLIELSYYCLITGFEGEKHLLSDGRQTLENLIDELHQLINQHRVHKPNQPLKEKITPLKTKINHKKTAIAASITFGAILSICFLSHILLAHKAHTILLEHQSALNKMDYK
jgi:type VI secretion system protein ImpK